MTDTKKASKVLEWKVLLPTDYAEIASRLIHFNAKTVNANARKTGIRLSPSHAHSLPYASAGAVPIQEIPLSCPNPRGPKKVVGQDDAARPKPMAAAKQLSDTYYSDTSKGLTYDKEPLQRFAEIFSYIEELRQFKEIGTDRVCARLRQVYFPVSSCLEQSYVLLTPLHSAGFSAYVKKAARRVHASLCRGVWPMGGKYATNCDIRAPGMGTPFVFELPKANSDVRKVLAIQHKGVSLTAHILLLRQYGKWLKAQKISTQESRYVEESYMVQIIREFEDRVHAARDRLEDAGTSPDKCSLPGLQLRLLFGEGVLAEDDVKAIAQKILLSFDNEPLTKKIADESRLRLEKFITRELRAIVL